jgi:hypothetical protein
MVTLNKIKDMIYTITLLSNFQVIKLEVEASSRQEANAIAINDAMLRGYSNIEII